MITNYSLRVIRGGNLFFFRADKPREESLPVLTEELQRWCCWLARQEAKLLLLPLPPLLCSCVYVHVCAFNAEGAAGKTFQRRQTV